MRVPNELAQVRLEILARREASEDARRARNHQPAKGDAVVVWRCDREHRGGRPKVAEAWRLPDGRILVVTRIPWIASDQLTLRPWLREHLLGAGINEPTLAGILADDRLLSRWLDDLDEWAAGKPASGPRWLKGSPPTWVATVISPDADPAITPWVRCKDHPEHAEPLRRADIFAAFR